MINALLLCPDSLFSVFQFTNEYLFELSPIQRYWPRQKNEIPAKKNSQELLLTARDYRVHMNKKVLEIIPPYIRAHNHGVDDK